MRNTMLLRKSEVPCVLAALATGVVRLTHAEFYLAGGPFLLVFPRAHTEHTELRGCGLMLLRTPSPPEKLPCFRA